MKQSILFLFILFFQIGALLAQTKVINNPAYEFKTSGIFNVEKIELSDSATRIYIHNTFLPKWWVSFDRKDTIFDSETGKAYAITGIEGAEFDKRLVMPVSGDSTIVQIYEPLDKGVRKIDYNKSIFGISLDESIAGAKKPAEVPAEVTKWLNAEVAKSKRKNPIDFNSSEFFTSGTGRLVGFIKGYDVRSDFSTAIIYASNVITREDFPVVIQIHSDGRFEANIPMNHPLNTQFSLSHFRIPFYLEPGQTLSIILDWEEFLKADRLRNIRYKLQNVVYQGPLAKVNQDLNGFKPKDFDYKKFKKKTETHTPEEFMNDQLSESKSQMKLLENYIAEHSAFPNVEQTNWKEHVPKDFDQAKLKKLKAELEQTVKDHNSKVICPQAVSILRTQTQLENATKMFDYVMSRSYQARKDTSNAVLKIPIPANYYGFLKEIPMNDQSMLVSGEFSTFINRFEFCELFRVHPVINQANITPVKSLLSFLQEEKVPLTEAQEKLLSLLDKKDKNEDDKAFLANNKNQIMELSKYFKDNIQAYASKYSAPLNKIRMANLFQESWRLKDSVLRYTMGLKPSLTYQIAKVRSLNFTFNQMDKELATTVWNNIKPGITNLFVAASGTQLLNETFPEDKVAATKLPEGAPTGIFRKIIDPFKGKILFVDFWATTCGPCVGSIKSMKQTRAKYYGNKDFEFIFITDERQSPEKDYTKFIGEQDMVNTFRIPTDEYNYLRQLFRFNGIPRYVVIDKNGDVINSNFPMHNFEFELKKILATTL